MVAAVLYLVFILIGALQYHAEGFFDSLGSVFAVIARIFTMPFTAWPDLLNSPYGTFFRFLEILFALGIIIYTFRRLHDGEIYMDVP